MLAAVVYLNLPFRPGSQSCDKGKECLGGWSLLAAPAADTIYSDPLWTYFFQSISTLSMQTPLFYWSVSQQHICAVYLTIQAPKPAI